MKRILLATACLTAVAAFTLPAAAHGPRGGGEMDHPGKGRFMEQLDTDGDGKVSDAEIQAHRDAMFAEIDSNKDGTLSEAEMTAHHEARRAEMQAKFAEHKADRVDAMFERFDTNEDGMISRDEVAAQQEAMDAKRAERRAEWSAKGEEYAAKRFTSMDADKDGTISKEEFDAAPMKSYRRGGKMGMRSGWMKDRDVTPPAPTEDE